MPESDAGRHGARRYFPSGQAALWRADSPDETPPTGPC
jgi:hypothetical protein